MDGMMKLFGVDDGLGDGVTRLTCQKELGGDGGYARACDVRVLRWI